MLPVTAEFNDTAILEFSATSVTECWEAYKSEIVFYHNRVCLKNTSQPVDGPSIQVFITHQTIFIPYEQLPP